MILFIEDPGAQEKQNLYFDEVCFFAPVSPACDRRLILAAVVCLYDAPQDVHPAVVASG